MIVGHTNEIFCEFDMLKYQQEQKIICSVLSYIIQKQLVLKSYDISSTRISHIFEVNRNFQKNSPTNETSL